MKNKIPKSIRDIFIITITSLFLFALIGCRAFLPISAPRTIDAGSWPLSRTIRWFSERRSNLKQIKAKAKVRLIDGGEKTGFDAVLVLNRNREGRIVGFGPLRSPIFYLVFNPDLVYFFNSNESRLYCSQNRPDFIQELTGLPLDLSLLFDSLVSNMPESLSQSSASDSKGEDHSILFLHGEDHGVGWEAGISIRDFPAIEEVVWTGEQMHENFRVKYGGMLKYDGYAFSEDIYFYFPKGRQWHITFNSLKVNQPVSKDIFVPDESWFSGEVVYLEDLGPQNGKIVRD